MQDGNFSRKSAGNGISSDTTDQSRGYDVSYQTLRATVETIILNPDDEGYSTTRIGEIGYRYLGENGSELRKARPIQSSLKPYPVLGEIVMIVEYANESYYYPPLNRGGFIGDNSMGGITGKESRDKDYSDTSNPPKSTSDSDYKIGEYFKSNKSLSALRPYEGDIIMQGRFGNNIRIGNNPIDGSNKPNIKFTNITDVLSTEYDILEEELDRDECIWMTSDETHIFKENGILIKGDGTDDGKRITSTTDDVWSGKQILIFSDRLIFRSKLNEIVGYSNMGIHWSSKTNFSVDSGDEVIINSKNNIETTTEAEAIFTSEGETQIQSLKTRIGKLDAKEPLVCGTLHQKILEEMLDLIIQHIHPTGTGPSGPPTTSTQFDNLKKKFEDTLSDDNFTTKVNS